MSQLYRLPPEVRGPFASAVNGEWANHRSPEAAWQRVSAAARSAECAVVEVTSPADGRRWGRGVELDAPPRGWTPRRRPSGPSGGKSQLPRVDLHAAREEIDAWDACASDDGVSRSEWLRAAANAEAARRSTR